MSFKRLAAGLREAGLNPGDVVALQLPNLPHFLTAYFGALKASLVVLPLNPLLMAPELEYHLGDSSATVLIGFEGGAHLHQRHDRQAQGRGAHPLPAVHELHGRGRGLREASAACRPR